MDIPKGMAKRQPKFDWQTAQTRPCLHNNNSKTNNKNMIVRDTVFTMTTTTTTTEIFINLNSLPANNHSGISIMKCLHVYTSIMRNC